MFHSFHTGLAEIHQYEPLVRRARARWTRELLQRVHFRLPGWPGGRSHRRPAAGHRRPRPEAT